MSKYYQQLALSTLIGIGSLVAIPLPKPVPVMAQSSFPITRVIFNVGGSHGFRGAEFTVPDTSTTASAGGGLRRYDAHIAKMFELTLYECQDNSSLNSDGIAWHYYAGNGEIDMGVFPISCALARNIATAYGLGQPVSTEVSYYRVNTVINVPKFNIVGGKVPTWLKFVQTLKPTFPSSQVSEVDDFAQIRSVIVQHTGYQGQVEVRPIHIVENYAMATYSYGHAGGQALLKRKNGGWEIITSDGGWIQDANHLMRFGVPRSIAVELESGPDI